MNRLEKGEVLRVKTMILLEKVEIVNKMVEQTSIAYKMYVHNASKR